MEDVRIGAPEMIQRSVNAGRIAKHSAMPAKKRFERLNNLLRGSSFGLRDDFLWRCRPIVLTWCFLRSAKRLVRVFVKFKRNMIARKQGRRVSVIVLSGTPVEFGKGITQSRA